MGGSTAVGRQAGAHRQHARAARVDRAGERPARMAGGGQLRPRRRPGRNADPAAGRSCPGAGRTQPGRVDRVGAAAHRRRRRGGAPRDRGRRLARIALRPAAAVQQADHRCATGGRFAAAGAAGAGRDVRHRDLARGTAHAGFVDAYAASPGRPADNAGVARRSPATLPVLPGLAA